MDRYGIPGGLRTLAGTTPNTWVTVRSVLADSTRYYLEQQRVSTGDTVRCLNARAEGIVVETTGGRRMLMAWDDAGAVQVQGAVAEPWL